MMNEARQIGETINAWEDINPPMVSARRQGQLSTCSDQTEARKVFRNELTACLALTAPVGMTEESRREWLAVAWETLRHIPPKDLERGAQKARQTCDHPAKIVPAIIKAVGELRPWEKYVQHYSPDSVKQIGVEYVTPEEAKRIREEVAAELAAERAARKSATG